jgi:GH15 family glucan-1,4-alpha-glucosidase
VAPTTRIEWLCLPRLDSPSVFGSLLDPDRGGSFGFEPADAGARMEMAYVANTNVLRTRVTASDGVFDVFDYAPRVPAGATVEAPLEIHRLVVPHEGQAHVRVRFDPRPDYARGFRRSWKSRTASTCWPLAFSSSCAATFPLPTCGTASRFGSTSRSSSF